MRLWAFALDIRACLPDHKRSRSASTAHLGRLTEGVLTPQNDTWIVPPATIRGVGHRSQSREWPRNFAVARRKPHFASSSPDRRTAVQP
jgi:hypothetical protein